tara:strand:- start:7568 stop:8236 length:669 start_codon:yes stop_codon:yes gene_type:complete
MINTKKCSQERWLTAQETEFNVWGGYNVGDGDDWSEYWKTHINNYDDIQGKHFENVIEVGCGPFGKNLSRVLELITYKNLYVLDPLLDKYTHKGMSGISNMCKNLNIEKLSIPLEEYTEHKNKMDLIICNNVLDHCYDSDKCFDNMYESLRSGGILIFGNDLKDESDIAVARDAMHPIMLQEDYLEQKFSVYESVFKKIIPREECRNTEACCGCIFTVLRKN